LQANVQADEWIQDAGWNEATGQEDKDGWIDGTRAREPASRPEPAMKNKELHGWMDRGYDRRTPLAAAAASRPGLDGGELLLFMRVWSAISLRCTLSIYLSGLTNNVHSNSKIISAAMQCRAGQASAALNNSSMTFNLHCHSKN
jgi:hypothetical protein